MAQKLGLKGFSLMGLGDAFVTMAQELLSAAWVKAFNTPSIQPASSMLTALGPHVRTILTPNSVLLVLCLDHLPAASAKDDEEPRCKPMLSEILITSWYEHEAARTQA